MLPQPPCPQTVTEMPNNPNKKHPFICSPHDDPALPETEARLRCANKRRLIRDLRMTIDSRWVSEWLFGHPSHPFHRNTEVPPEAFDNSLAVRGLQFVHGEDHAQSASANSGTRGLRPGNDMLLVGVAHSEGKLIGYSFGGLQKPSGSCTYDARACSVFSHFVGRFSFDVAMNEFLIVIPRMNSHVTGILGIRKGDGRIRERNTYVVPNGTYGYKRLPSDIMALSVFAERRLASIPKYQFATGTDSERSSSSSRGGVRTDMRIIRADLAKLERLLKGKFFSPRMCMDTMDTESGELTSRTTSQIEAKFDVIDAVALRQFRDTSMSSFFSYMASVEGSSGGTGSRS